jgi:hypothetical protein
MTDKTVDLDAHRGQKLIAAVLNDFEKLEKEVEV